MIVCCYLWFLHLAFIEKEIHMISQCSPPFLVIFRIVEPVPPSLMTTSSCVSSVVDVSAVFQSRRRRARRWAAARAGRRTRARRATAGPATSGATDTASVCSALPRVSHPLRRASSLCNILSTFQTATSASGRARARSAAPTCSAPTRAPASTGIRCATTTNPALL